MTVAYFDCFSGIAGDMSLAALIDCGVPIEALREGLSSLPVEGWDVEVTPVLKNGIHALTARITLHGISDDEEHQLRQQAAAGVHGHGHSDEHHGHDHHHDHDHEHHHAHDHHHGQGYGHEHGHSHGHDHHHHGHSHSRSHDHHDHGHAHEHHHDHHHDHAHHGHSHDHSHAHDHGHGHSHDDEHTHGRSMREIREVITASALPERVKENALKIFGIIAAAEAKIHHTTIDEVHFHEIGGVDSLIDICGVAWCLDYLGVDEVYFSALPHSTGHVHCAHGVMPVPAPASMEILRDAPFFPTDLKGEVVTPTGAGIVKALSAGFEAPAFVPSKVGVGAGKKNFPNRPNILRVTIGEKSAAATAASSSTLSGLEWRSLVLLETNVDDMNPELWDYVFEQIFAAGALDVWLQPIQMKKNRPAQTLRVLVEEASRDAAIAAILRETTTLGMRVSEVQRVSLRRSFQTVSTPWGEVRVKIARWEEGGVQRAAPEYDDVARVAREQGVAARAVYAAAQAAFEVGTTVAR